jgi:N-acetylmuramoyl-L-alanine amidase
MPEKYTVQPGDCIASIAFERGFFQDTLWDHADNADLKQRRKDPHVLLPGDTVSIPDKRVEDMEKPPEKRHRFRRKGVPKFIQFQLLENDEPVASMGCDVTIDGIHARAKTDGQGWFKHPISPGARAAHLLFDNGAEYELELGHLDPIDTVEGVQQRLESLRHYTGEIDGQMNPETVEALKEFQLRHGLQVTGQSDQPTKDELAKQFGG